MSSLVVLLSGPNLNLLGEREPAIYGTETLADHVARAEATAARHGLTLEHLQSNHEGALVEAVHDARGRASALVINAGALSHTSWSLHDAVAAFEGPAVELHLSNPAAREPFRHTSVLAPVTAGLVAGFGGLGYELAVDAVAQLLKGATCMTLPPMSVAGRLDALRARFDGFDALVVTTLPNIRYLTGFAGSAGLLAVTPHGALLTTDGRYRTQSAKQVSEAGADVDITIGNGTDQRKAVSDFLSTSPRVGLEADNVSWSGQRTWASLLTSTELVPTTNAVEALREVKDEAEIALMERAAAIADAALYEVLPLMSEGATEEQFALALDSAMRRGGAEGTAFETIVAAGENSAMPHHRPGPRPIRQGDAVVVDFGATYEGYRSDMTRTFCVGVEPEGDMARVFAVVGRVAGCRCRCGAAGDPGQGSGRGLPRHHRGGRLGRSLRARHGSRRGARHPRGTDGQPTGHCYAGSWLRCHRRARCLPPRPRWRTRRGHPGGDGGRKPTFNPFHEGHSWHSRLTT